jgi:hypothetical protein
MQVEFFKGDAFKKPYAQGRKKSADVILVMPYLDQLMAQRCAELMSRRAGTDGLIIAVQDTDRDGFIAVANRVIENTKSGVHRFWRSTTGNGRAHWPHSDWPKANGRGITTKECFFFRVIAAISRMSN